MHHLSFPFCKVMIWLWWYLIFVGVAFLDMKMIPRLGDGQCNHLWSCSTTSLFLLISHSSDSCPTYNLFATESQLWFGESSIQSLVWSQVIWTARSKLISPTRCTKGITNESYEINRDYGPKRTISFLRWIPHQHPLINYNGNAMSIQKRFSQSKKNFTW